MKKLLRLISISIAAAMTAGIFSPAALAAKPAVTIDGLPNVIIPPKESTATYSLSGYLDGAYSERANFSVSGGDASGYTLDPSGEFTITPQFLGTYVGIKCSVGDYSVTQNVYTSEHSLVQGAVSWAFTGWGETGHLPQQVTDGNEETYWSAGNHSAASNAKLVISTGGVKYNRIKLSYPHTTNSSQTEIFADDVMTSMVPAASGISSSDPAMQSPVTLYSRLSQPMYERTYYIPVTENNKKYLMFKSRVEKASPATPFQLNEILLFYVLEGDVRIDGIENEVRLPQSGSVTYKLSSSLFDTLGKPMTGEAYTETWSASTPEGVTFDGDAKTLMVSSDAKESKVILTLSATLGNVTLVAQKQIDLIQGKITIYDDLMREVNGFAKPGTYYASAASGTPSNKIILAKYDSTGKIAGISTATGNNVAQIAVDPSTDAAVKAFCWDNANRPNAKVWQVGGEIPDEQNATLLEKSFTDGTTGLTGIYRVNGTVTEAGGLMTAAVDKNGIWLPFDRTADGSIVIDTRLKTSTAAELYVKDADGHEITYPLTASSDLQDITLLINKLKNVWTVNEGIKTPLDSFGTASTVGIRDTAGFIITMQSLKCYTGLKSNKSLAKDYMYNDRTPTEASFLTAKQNSVNAVIMATDYDIAYFYGRQVKLPKPPKDISGTAYLPLEVVKLLGGTVSSQTAAEMTAKLGSGASTSIPITDGYITAANFAGFMGKNLYYDDGVLTFAADAPTDAPADVLNVLYHYRPTGGEILEDVETLGVRPRIIANQAVIERAKNNIATNSTVANWYNTKVLALANGYLTKPVEVYEIVDGRLLAVSTEVYERVSNLGFVYKMTGDTRYAERAWQELENAASFADWHPGHFLDVGEMSLAFAVGYDWFNDYLTPSQKRILVKAFEKNGLAPFVTQINKGDNWAAYDSNWNIWIRNGVLSCVLSMAEDLNNKGEASFALEKGITGMENLLANFAPKGAWYEGTQYWEGTTRFLANFIDALEFSTGRYWGYDNLPGFALTRYYSAMLTGSGGAFNFSDTTVKRDNPPVEFWLANRFNDPGLTNLRFANMKNYNLAATLLDILWYVPTGTTELAAPPSNDIFYENIDTALFHGGWTTPSLFGAIKGADIGASHFHYDGGNFIFDMGGKRFAYELGRDGYASTDGTWTGPNGTWATAVSKRNYSYKIRAEGHNVLLLNPSADPGQKQGTVAHITAYEENADERHAIVDTTDLYKDPTPTVTTDGGYTGQDMKRGFKVYRNTDTIVVQDEVHLTQSSELYWFMHTQGTVTVSADGRSATITQGSGSSAITVKAEILGDSAAQFTKMAASILPTTPLLPNQGSNTAYTKLTIHWASVQDTTFAVRFIRGTSTDGATLISLADW